MRKILPLILFVLVEFTSPMGDKVYVVPGSIADITPATEGRMYAPPTSKTQIRTFNGSLFVRETPEEVAKRVRDAN